MIAASSRDQGLGVITAAGRQDAGAFLTRLLRLDPAALVRLRPVPAVTATAAMAKAVATAAARQAAGAGAAGVTAAAGVGVAEIWAMLPFRVLVVRRLAADLAADTTVEAAALLRFLEEADKTPEAHHNAPPRRDEAWRWPLPPSRGHAVETVPAAEVARVAAAASRTLRVASERGVRGRPIGERVVRDTLLDHVAIVVSGSGAEHAAEPAPEQAEPTDKRDEHHAERVEVPQRLVQAVVRMGFLGAPTTLPALPTARQPAPEAVTFGDVLVTVRWAGGWVGLDALHGSAWYRKIFQLGLS